MSLVRLNMSEKTVLKTLLEKFTRMSELIDLMFGEPFVTAVIRISEMRVYTLNVNFWL